MVWLFRVCNFAAAMSSEKKTKGASKSQQQHYFEGWAFNRNNYLILLAGVAFIVFGYVVMALGGTNGPLSLTVAPIMLFIGYLVLVPLSLIYRKKTTDK